MVSVIDEWIKAKRILTDIDKDKQQLQIASLKWFLLQQKEA